ncbi:MAG: hydantoinase/oxoprolinase family protein [Acidimicrobiaceae bacterium]|nr:hydantoinase/oxoprolinase family protein [Acidimicrobiaceae bacterium]
MRIGVDVGGTNTDAVAFDGKKLLALIKTPTTADVISGVTLAIGQIVNQAKLDVSSVSAVMVGTTHFTNAIVEAKHLLPTAIVRLCGRSTRALPPMRDWPPFLRDIIGGEIFLLNGGHEFDGRLIEKLDLDEIDQTIKRIGELQLQTVAISSVFSPVNACHEKEVSERFSVLLPNVAVSISSEIGRIGLLERENATILNACLRGIADKMIAALNNSIRDLGIEASLFISQNDGTLMSAEYTNRYPIATFASGPTNSMRGAAFLSGQTDCAVIDIGGTTSDIGILRAGFPREASSAVNVGGVRTNFRMPDVHSIGVGGGSIIRTDSGLSVGPDSVGFRIRTEALVFGGSTLTATDLAVAAGRADVGDRSLVAHLDQGMVRDALELIRQKIGTALDAMMTTPEPIPVVLVGGGHIICGDDIPNTSATIRPNNLEVANAVGAAIAQVGSQVDRIVPITPDNRNQAIEQIRHETIARCISAGAIPQSVSIIEIEEVPLAYLPSNSIRIRMRAVGDLDFVK